MLQGILDSFRSGANQDAADEAIRTGKPVQLGFLEKFYGGTKEDAQNIVDTANQKSLNRQYSGAAVAAGLNPFKSGFANYGEGEASFVSRIAKAQEAKTEQERQRRRGELKEDNELALSNATTLKGMDLEAARDQYLHSSTMQENRYAHENKQNRLDRRHQVELSDSKDNLQMQLAIMNNDLSEKRMEYDRETRRMDKRDRMIAELMSGLGSLGSAFG